MFEIEVFRSPSGEKATEGKMSINGVFQCVTLEPVVREVPGQPVASWKIWGKTAIPEGRYPVILDYSPHFGQIMPHVTNVPGFDEIRIHWGNDDADTDGCVLVGQEVVNEDFIGDSRLAFGAFFPKLEAAINSGEGAFLTVHNAS